MSGVNISILEGGKTENFGQVTKLRTSNGSDHDLWVPKTDVETKHLSVKKNGLHYTNQYEPTASEKKEGKFHDVYGWDTITVSVNKKAKGKKKKISPSTGIEYDAPTSVDVDDDGNLVETELPVSIDIKTPPNKLEYRDGENISKTGMVVKAYYADDSEWGIVPLDEISIDPPIASGGGGGFTPEDNPFDLPSVEFALTPSTWVQKTQEGYSYHYTKRFIGYEYGIVVRYGTGDVRIIVVSRTGDNKWYGWGITDTPSILPTPNPPNNLYQFTYDGKTAYYTIDNMSTPLAYCDANVPLNDIDISTNKYGELAWLILYGSPDGSSETITVGWTPPQGEDELTDTFDITVTP